MNLRICTLERREFRGYAKQSLIPNRATFCLGQAPMQLWLHVSDAEEPLPHSQPYHFGRLWLLKQHSKWPRCYRLFSGPSRDRAACSLSSHWKTAVVPPTFSKLTLLLTSFPDPHQLREKYSAIVELHCSLLAHVFICPIVSDNKLWEDRTCYKHDGGYTVAL